MPVACPLHYRFNNRTRMSNLPKSSQPCECCNVIDCEIVSHAPLPGERIEIHALHLLQLHSSASHHHHQLLCRNQYDGKRVNLSMFIDLGLLRVYSGSGHDSVTISSQACSVAHRHEHIHMVMCKSPRRATEGCLGQCPREGSFCFSFHEQASPRAGSGTWGEELVPVVCSHRQHAQQPLRTQDGCGVRARRAVDGGHDRHALAPRRHTRDGAAEALRVRHMLYHLRSHHDIESSPCTTTHHFSSLLQQTNQSLRHIEPLPLHWSTLGVQLLRGALSVLQALLQAAVRPHVQLCRTDGLSAGVHPRHVAPQSRQRLQTHSTLRLAMLGASSHMGQEGVMRIASVRLQAGNTCSKYEMREH